MNTVATAVRDDFYGGQPPVEIPMYTRAAASRYLRIPESTIRWWSKGREHQGYAPVLPAKHDRGLSFLEMLELHALSELRRVHNVPLNSIRAALAFAERELNIERVLLDERLLTFGGDIFLDHLGDIVSLSRSGQVAMRQILEGFMARIERDGPEDLPIRFFPRVRGAELVRSGRPISLSPLVAFGRPTIAGTGIRTSIVVARIDAGESVEELAHDYGVAKELVESAITYELAA